MEFGEVVKVMDAVAATKREIREGSRVAMVPAFSSTFSVR
jgi:hypothetical protein